MNYRPHNNTARSQDNPNHAYTIVIQDHMFIIIIPISNNPPVAVGSETPTATAVYFL